MDPQTEMMIKALSGGGQGMPRSMGQTPVNNLNAVAPAQLEMMKNIMGSQPNGMPPVATQPMEGVVTGAAMPSIADGQNSSVGLMNRPNY